MQTMFDWANPTPAVAGMRLLALEVYNWGTFHQHIWIIGCDGQTALLTGANGSGKSTLVDALLTLLVPSPKRHYNQAAGERRRERDEQSYVRGAYGRQRDGDSTQGETKYLRPKGTPSVLLARFGNHQSGQTVTLAQFFFWNSDGQLRKLHVVASQPLSIQGDFGPDFRLDAIRKQLRAAGAELFDDFSRYSARASKLLGVRSDKALDLFNQTVSIKEIGSLNEFVRQHMLERHDVQATIDRLIDSYQNLTSAYDAVKRAEDQLTRLGPLLEESEQYQETTRKVTEAEACGEVLPTYIAERQRDLLAAAIRETEKSLEAARTHGQQAQQQVAQLRAREQQLEQAILNDSAGQMIRELERQRAEQELLLSRQRTLAEQYNDRARALGLPAAERAETFFDNRREIEARLPQLEQRQATLVAQRDEAKHAERELATELETLRAEILSLRERQSRIPSEDLRLREGLADALGLDPTVMPFVGELLRVQPGAKAWEGAIERLLHSFGRRLLVPDALYGQVSQYVDATNLRGRLVYHRIGEIQHVPSESRLDPQALYHKLEIRPDTPFYDWLKRELIDQWDYVCCETLEEFRRQRRALTRTGQIRRGESQHEKDDRSPLGDARRYVLGWDNRETLKANERLGVDLHKKLSARREQTASHEAEQRRVEKQLRQLETLLTSYTEWEPLDWPATAAALDTLNQNLVALSGKADHLELLREQLREAQAALKDASQRVSQADRELGRIEAQQTELQNQQTHAEMRLTAEARNRLAPYRPILDADARGREFHHARMSETQTEMSRLYQNRASSYRGQATALGNRLVSQMVNFKRDFPLETQDFTADLEALHEWRAFHTRLERDDLPTYRQRFKEWLNSKVVEAITGFNSELRRRESDIRQSIEVLNRALAGIDYTPATYIRLSVSPTPNPEVKAFRQQLQSAIPNVGQRSIAANEESFQRIRTLIHAIQSDARWSEKVTDVRNWLEFAAEECYRQDGSIKNYYEDSSGKSGGQKAKLAYTILASAIAYQYGLDQASEAPRAFRFVVVDEAFSKSDEDNARYAMELFRKLNLQLLLVTPMDKTHVVEPYIGACHYVFNSTDENNSQVLTMTIDAFRAERQRLATLAHPA